jgi:hypothetical protein
VLAGLIGGLGVGLGAGLDYGLAYGLGGGLVDGLVAGLVFALVFGLGVGLLVGLLLGGGDALRHTVLRWVLRQRGLVPPQLVQYLNSAADHVLLQRVGGGYRFIHILLRDYFADLRPQPPGPQPKA